ncbi:conserved exported hypothetical protein [Bradyrhizobium sp. STM 3843]|uniref:DUF4424 domain-containing protein n=1 Tax=Bradyrhizobium sp. STM 3843 TaxID=551947 RepID=UPI000240AF99|nr:DUF4424 domain-containing protein [Bradyrhizobium sp. STM 3843]CCE06323.1 conserved exported hypothetical protein [Bradyrhizobium sp. STM 3843]
MGKEQSIPSSFRAGALMVALLVVVGWPARANDSAAELSIGGLQFVRTNDVAMESEDLHIALDRISVRYQFANLTPKPVTLTVAFPLPDIDLSEAENIALPSNDPVNFVDFETKVDGSPAPMTIDQRAMIGDKDVTALLRELKLPLLPIGSREIRVADLPVATRTRLVDDGLLMPAGMSDNGHQQYAPGWVTRTSAVRQQVFSPARSVIVEHQYRPSVGSSPDTILRPSLRRSSALAQEVARYRKEYCIQDAFLAELDKRAGSGQANTAKLQERRISYVLKTGANWAGPIRSFKLTIDPGGSDRLVSFCPGRLRASSSTGNMLEYTASDFKPDADLKILVIGTF